MNEERGGFMLDADAHKQMSNEDIDASLTVEELETASGRVKFAGHYTIPLGTDDDTQMTLTFKPARGEDAPVSLDEFATIVGQAMEHLIEHRTH
ncbi:hypothetical protein ACF3NT_08875 [Naumannella halotolerans]|uniref:hypothetical protein n=1 Tax=Naumannella halotolerans TaxID=993414 RepID=UPI00370D1EF0